MYKAPSKRKKRTQLFFIYSLMITSVVAIVAILVLILLGYRFNRFDGKVESVEHSDFVHCTRVEVHVDVVQPDEGAFRIVLQHAFLLSG